MKIVIGADIVPTPSNYDLFIKGDVDELIGQELVELLKLADYTILNLETPLTNRKKEIKKCGPCLMAPVETINGISKINSCFFTLANNHIMDQQFEGLQDTIKCLEQSGISYSGVGKDLENAQKPFEVVIKGIRLGIYCCAEHEFSIATETMPGACPYDPLISFDVVQELRQRCDIVIVLYHGGKEHYRYPSPMLQKVFRKFSSSGADYVIAQHTHCIGCIEQYGGSYLVYGQGNFLFDDGEEEDLQTAILLSITVDEINKTHSLNIIPICRRNNTVRKADAEKTLEVFSTLTVRNKQIKNQGFIEEKYADFADQMLDIYLSKLNGNRSKSLLYRVINRILCKRVLHRNYSYDCLLEICNSIECEAHRELLLQALHNKE